MVLVTHDLGEAGFLGDLLILMQQGKIVQQDSFRNLIEKPAEAFRRGFISNAPSAIHRSCRRPRREQHKNIRKK